MGVKPFVIMGASFVATAGVAVAGVSVMEPALPGRGGQPPWALPTHPSAFLVVPLTAVALATGAIGLLLALRAVRAGWRPSPLLLLGAGLLAATVLTLLPPFGSSDPLSYAAYGRMVVTGHNPYLTTPAQLAAHGDPVAGAVQDWYQQVSVYGPLASGIQALAAQLAGTSVRLTVFGLAVANLLAFAATAVLLHRMTATDPARQLRAALLWTANPLLLQVLIAGGHVDVQAIAVAVAAVAVAHRRAPGVDAVRVDAVRVEWREMVRMVLAGALVGLSFAVKVTGALIGLALAIAVLQQCSMRDGSAARGERIAWRRALPLLAGLVLGFGVTGGVAVAIGGSAMLRAASRASDMVSIGSPWRAIRSALQPVTGHAAATDLVKYGAVLLAVVLAVLLLRAGTYAPLALVLAWLFAWPYVLPWYDALGWAFLGLAAASELDWLLLARTTALGFGYLPARIVTAGQAKLSLPAGLRWVQPVFRDGVAPVVLAVTTIWLIVVLLRRRGVPVDHDPNPLQCVK